MAYEQNMDNFVNPTDVISAAMAEAFVAQSVGLNLVTTQAFPDNTNVIKFRKAGSLTAQTITEGSNFTYGSTTELTDSSVSATGAKKEMATKHSLESLRFGGDGAQLARFAAEHGRALARLFDYDLKALFSAIATRVTATSTLTKDDVLDARYNIFKSVKGAFSGKLAAMLDFKGVKELDKELTSITASAFVQQVPLGVLGVPQVNGLKGELFGIEVYQVDGLPTSCGDDIGCVWDPNLCFAAGIDGNQFQSSIDFLGSQGGYYELVTWTFWHVIEWNDTAGCGLLSDT